MYGKFHAADEAMSSEREREVSCSEANYSTETGLF